MATLATQLITLPSLLPTFVAANVSGDAAVPGNNTFLVVKNGGGSPINLTLAVPGTDDFGTANPDPVIAVANGTERYIPLRHSKLLDPSTGLCSWTYSAITSVTVGVVTM